ncbi:hypothetical protein [Paenibacillus sp. FSL L8-0158]|uniref:hypothetical protein n=1 Tax=Paenibacillus sp. FSL L8-0158 TaxID=2954752 RepID=UPI00315988AD
MNSKKYEMSEKVFIDIWKKHNSPNVLYGNQESFLFLEDLFDNTDGLFIIDHFSHYNYDNLCSIENKGDFIHFVWKDFVKNPPPRGFESMTFDIYSAHYIFSLCNINEIKFVNLRGHLYILIMPIVAKVKEVKKYLEINHLDETMVSVKENLEELFTSIRYLKDVYIHECILHNIPFFSFLLQPKERSLDTGFSKLILMYATLDHVNDRLRKVKVKINRLNEFDFDEIRARGNTIRTILESLIKYYSIYYNYSLPEDHYGNNVLGKLKKNLKNDPLMNLYLQQEMIDLANDFSHDTGYIRSKKQLLELINFAETILAKIIEKMKNEEKEDDYEDELEDDLVEEYIILDEEE